MPSVLYAGTAGGVYKSMDDGATWSNTGLDGSISALVVAPDNSLKVYAGIDFNGLYKSTDGGASWSYIHNGFPASDRGLNIFSLAVDPVTPSTLYAGIYYVDCGPLCSDYFELYKSTNEGLRWDFSSNGLPNISTNALAIDPATPATLYAGTGDGVYKTVNSGDSWSATSSSPSGVQTLAIDPATPSTVYAGAFNNNFNAFVTKIGA
jgi:photosystem II stability/assembly factor-like uncharacterized protein